MGVGAGLDVIASRAVMQANSRWRGVGALALGLTLVSVTVRAEELYPVCGAEPSPAEVEAAQGAFKAGKAAFEEADYDRAIDYWLDAYRRDCRAHDLLQNLARAYELRGDEAAAIVALETFLERRPDVVQREQFERRIERLKAQLAAESAPPATEPDAAAPPAVPAGGVAAVPAMASPARGRRPVAPLLVAGAGGVLAAVGGVLWFVAHDDAMKYEREDCAGDRGSCPADIVDEARAARTREIVAGAVAVGGIGVAAGGVVWYVVTPPKPTAQGRAARLVPLVGRGFVGASVSGRF